MVIAPLQNVLFPISACLMKELLLVALGVRVKLNLIFRKFWYALKYCNCNINQSLQDMVSSRSIDILTECLPLCSLMHIQ